MQESIWRRNASDMTQDRHMDVIDGPVGSTQTVLIGPRSNAKQQGTELRPITPVNAHSAPLEITSTKDGVVMMWRWCSLQTPRPPVPCTQRQIN